MVVEVKMDLALQKAVSVNSYGLIIVDIQDGMTVSEVLDEMEINYKTVRFVTVNGIPSSMGYILSDGDKISLFSNGK